MSDDLFSKVYNPDVLSCLANLSNDEVFTSPDVVNQMLDMLPQELFENPDTTFLDPACKTGVFLREIAKRLVKGLENQIPDLQERVDHIFHKQLYGIAITELTSLLSRRGVYCSKYANSEFSITKFKDADGNIRYKRTNHTWGKTTYDASGKPHASCIYCGASKNEYDRGTDLETHAYEFIHGMNIEEVFKMKFDVIISNPPYQLSTGGGQAQATPLYDKFVETAIKLQPNYVAMIIPARWYAGGFPCIKTFREYMTSTNNVKEIHDFSKAEDCFSGVEIKGGVCYFLWDKNYKGKCNFYNHSGDKILSKETRYLLESGCDTVIRDNEAIDILHQVRAKGLGSFSEMVGSLWPFTTKSTFDSLSDHKTSDTDIFAYVMKNKGWIKWSEITRGSEFIDKYKILLPRSVGSADVKTDKVKPIIAEPNTCCSGTYLICGPFKDLKEAENVKSYINTKFFHFLLSLKKVSQDTVRGCYDFIPKVPFGQVWNDSMLYKFFKLTNEQINYIESTVWPNSED